MKQFFRQLKSDKLQQIHIFTAILDLLKDGVQVDGITLEEAEVKVYFLLISMYNSSKRRQYCDFVCLLSFFLSNFSAFFVLSSATK